MQPPARRTRDSCWRCVLCVQTGAASDKGETYLARPGYTTSVEAQLFVDIACTLGRVVSTAGVEVFSSNHWTNHDNLWNAFGGEAILEP